MACRLTTTSARRLQACRREVSGEIEGWWVACAAGLTQAESVQCEADIEVAANEGMRNSSCMVRAKVALANSRRRWGTHQRLKSEPLRTRSLFSRPSGLDATETGET